MTKEEALKTMQEDAPVIYTGAGSLRNSKESIGLIKKINSTTADIKTFCINQCFRFKIAEIRLTTPEEFQSALVYTLDKP